MAPFTVKARSRYGTHSLDLTIPAKIVQGANIEAGDIFTVESQKSKEGEIMLVYKRVFKQNRTSASR